MGWGRSLSAVPACPVPAPLWLSAAKRRGTRRLRAPRRYGAASP